ncbi:outer membrane protein transport protein [bacterium]|nr:outer membrane protein transport protein [bacterium]
MLHRRSLLICLLFLMTGVIHAQDESDAIRPFQNEFGPGARAMALGGAYSAVAEDYTAVYWNPAGLAQIRKMEFYGSLSHLSLNNRIGYQGTTTENTNGFTNMNAIGAVFPIPTYRGSLVFGIGYHRINSFDDFNQVIGSPRDNTGRSFYQNEKTTAGGNLNQWSFSGAVDLTKTLSVGATLNLLVGKNNNDVSYFEDDSYDDLLLDVYTREVEFQINPDYSGVGFKMGALLKPSDNLRVAVTVTAPSSLKAEENSTYSEYLVYDDSTPDDLFVSDSFLKYRITSPWKFDFGASYKYQLFLLTGAVEMTDWTQTRFHSNILDDNSKDIDGEINQNILSNYRQATNYRFGAEAAIPNLGIKAMAGYFYQESPFKKGRERIASNKQFLSGGLSFLLDKQVKIDAAYQHGWWKQSATDFLLGTDYQGNQLVTHETITANRFVISLSYRF